MRSKTLVISFLISFTLFALNAYSINWDSPGNESANQMLSVNDQKAVSPAAGSPGYPQPSSADQIGQQGNDNPRVSLSGTQLNQTEWLDVGLNLYYQNRYNDSLQAFDKIVEINPLNTVAWKMMGVDLGYLGKYDQALTAFSRAAETNSSDAEPWYDMGRIYDLQGDLNSAIEAYNHATQIDPNYQAAWFHKDQDMDTMGIGHTSLYNELQSENAENAANAYS